MPLETSNVDIIAKSMLVPPNNLPEIVIAAPSTDWDPMKHKGAWKRVSPEEEVFAVVKCVRRDIENRTPEAILTQWRTLLLTQPYTIEDLPDGPDRQRFYRAMNLREKRRTQAVLARSPFGRIFEVVAVEKSLARSKANVTPQHVYDDFVAKAQFSPVAEPLSLNLIDNSLSIYRRAFCIPEVKSVVKMFDSKFGKGSVFDTMTKLFDIVTICKTKERITWAFLAIADLFQSKLLSPGDLAGSNPQGRMVVKAFFISSCRRWMRRITFCTITWI